jgi:integrase
MPKLTPASVEKHKPNKHQRREIPDAACPGLYLIIQTSGSKSFAMRFRGPTGRHQKLTLGRLDLTGHEAPDDPILGAPLTLLSARRLASEINRQRARRMDVVAARHRDRLEYKAGGARTFSQAALDFCEQHLKRETRRWTASARLLGIAIDDDGKLVMMPRGLVDRWRDRPISEINGDDIHLVVDETREKSVPGLPRRAGAPSESMARSMHSCLSTMFAWLLEKRRVKINPVIGVAMPKSSKPRERTLTDDEIKKFWIACDKVGEPASQCLKLLLLTGCRLNEIAKLRRSEINDKDHTVTIPSSRVKNKREFVLPLSPMAWNILQSVQTTGDLFFTTERGKPVSSWSKIKRRLDAAMKTTPWRLHDLRRCFSTNLNKLGIQPHVVESCLNHASGFKASVAGVYNQWHYLPEKKVALERWAEHIDGLIVNRAAKVVSMKKARVAK